MNAKQIAIETIQEAKDFPNTEVMPTTENANTIVVIFNGKTFSESDNGDGAEGMTEDEALTVLEHDIQQNIDLFAE